MRQLQIGVFFTFICFTHCVFSQTNQWAWIKGDNIINQPAVYGSMGVSSPLNKPGARHGSHYWKDLSGKLWMFGGFGYSGTYGALDDLWKYDISSNMWTWVKGSDMYNPAPIFGTKGVASALNSPGGRQNGVTWCDNAGNLWIFGGHMSGNERNDLWKYKISTNEWTWVKGSNLTNRFGSYGTKGVEASTNSPGSRSRGISWIDGTGNLWLFGGEGFSEAGYGWLNDLWRYNPASNSWTWVSGDKVENQLSIPGTQGIESVFNKPGARTYCVGWGDGVNLWLFGGMARIGSMTDINNSEELADLWKFNISTQSWTWVQGDPYRYTQAVYGSQGVPSSGNTPGSRSAGEGISDGGNIFWLFGGMNNRFGPGTPTYLNDLWKYNVSTNEWTWGTGDNITNAQGVYGVQGIPALTNKPGARWGSSLWISNAGDIWLFGGQGYDKNGQMAWLNDLWGYLKPCTNDISDPVLTCPSDISTYSAPATCSKAIITTNPVYSDNCSVTKLTWTLSGATALSSPASGTRLVGTKTFNLGTTAVTYTATDAAGNNNSCSYNVVVTDNRRPEFLNANSTISEVLISGCTKQVSIPDVTFSDNCSTPTLGWVMTGATVGSGSGQLGSAGFNSGVTTVTYTLTDAAGNTRTSSFTVTITDNIPPALTCPADITTQTSPTACNKSVQVPQPIYNDNCAVTKLTWVMTGATTLSSPTNGVRLVGTKIFNVGTTTVTYAATDAVGNTTTCSFNVVVSDNRRPVFLTTNSNISSSCSPVAVTDITYSDNCGTPVLTWVMTGATTDNGTGQIGTKTFNSGVTAVTYTLTDAAGNSQTSSFAVTVAVDNVLPVITCPGNTAAACNASTAVDAPVYSDNCSVASLTWAMTGATSASSPATGINTIPAYSYNTGTTTITYTVYDAAGNNSSCSHTVTVADGTPPIITCPANRTDTTTNVCYSNGVNFSYPQFSDGCSGIASLTWSMTGANTGSSVTTGVNYLPVQSYNLGVTTITYTATDAVGNSNTCSFTETVRDNIAPFFNTGISNITQNLVSGCSKSIAMPAVTFYENCSTPTLSWIMTGATTGSGTGQMGTTVFNFGITTVSYTLTDAAGNTRTASFSVNIKDNIAPVIACPASMTINTTGCSQYISAVPEPAFSDNCVVTTLLWSLTGATTGNATVPGISYIGSRTFNKGVTTALYTADDGHLNSTSCTFSIIVNSPASCSAIAARGFEDLQVKSLTVQLLPNPTNTAFSLQIDSEKSAPVEVTVYTIDGIKLQHFKTVANKVIKFGERYTRGTYIIEARQGEQRVRVKGVKE